MTILEIVLATSLAANLAALVGLVILKRRKPGSGRTFDATAQDLLHDLTTRGGAVLRIEVINPESIILRR